MIKKVFLFLFLFFLCFIIRTDSSRGLVGNFFPSIPFSSHMLSVYYEVPYFVLKIPKIGLERNVYALGSQFNDVDFNVELLDGSIIERNIFFLAGHSGSGDDCFFNRLVELDVGEVVVMDFGDVVYSFFVDEIYFIDKNGYMDVSLEDNTLYLITCSLSDYNKQLVIVCHF